MPSSRSRKIVALSVLLLLPLLSRCESKRAVAESTISGFLGAVQLEDLDALYCLLYGASETESGAEEVEARRLAFDRWVGARYDSYLAGRDDGHVDIGDDGIVLAKMLALGKGTYYSLRSVRGAAEDTLVVDMDVTLAYADISITELPPRTTFYVATLPMGSVRPVRIPSGAGEVTVEVIDTMVVRWTLVWSGGTASCPEGWTVAEVTPLDDSVVVTEVTWEFGTF
ncbi:MAG: hypothetical protein R3344_00510 [Acidobacteriota bacterium]|nr:hypothetical protein [Acidobacteriota bacterium]